MKTIILAVAFVTLVSGVIVYQVVEKQHQEAEDTSLGEIAPAAGEVEQERDSIFHKFRERYK